MFWYNVISNNPSYYFKMHISEITKKKKNMIYNLSYLLNNVSSLKTRVFFVLLAVLSPIPGTSSEAKITVEFLRGVNGFLGNSFQAIQTMDHFTK